MKTRGGESKRLHKTTTSDKEPLDYSLGNTSKVYELVYR
jgi:hypothetical protein